MCSSQLTLVVKNLPVNAGDLRDMGSIPGLGRSSGGGHGNPIQYSCLENPMDRGAWQATLNGVTKSQTEAIYKIGNQQRPTVERRGLYSISCNNL